jgi:phospholipid transport system substrate-binding protein
MTHPETRFGVLLERQPAKRRPARSAAARVALVLLALASAPALADPAVAPPDVSASSARATVEESSKRVLTVLNAGGTSDEKLARLREIGFEVFDTATVARLSLARNWNRLSPAQQEEFVPLFRQLLITTYGKRLDTYGNQSVVVVSDRTEPRGDVTVQTKVVGGNTGEVRVDYRMRAKNGTWLCIDVVVEGVSLVASYRSQFESMLSQSGPDGLLGRIREINASGAGLPVEAIKGS